VRIQSQLLVGLVLLFGGAGIALFLTLSLFVLPHVEDLEERALIKDVIRVQKQLESTQQQLYAFARDYAEWDETYRFMQDRNRGYADSNLVAGTLDAVDADVLVYLDNDNLPVTQLYNQAAVDLLGDKSLSKHLAGLPAQPQSGYIRCDDKVLIFARRAITDTDVEQPPRGTLYFLKFIDADLTKQLSSMLGFDISLQLSDRSSAEERIEVGFFGGNRSVAWRSIELLQEPRFVLTLRIEQSRPFYSAAWETMAYTLLSLFVMGSVLSVGVFLYLNRNLVKPIQQLKQQAEVYGRTGDPAQLKLIKRQDELGLLSESFVRMAHRLESHRQSLEDERQHYRDASYTDPLTGLRNRRFLEQYLEDHFLRGLTNKWLFVFFDLDHFKRVNDRYGHDVGDIALEQMATLVQAHCREGDTLVRQGGEEFVLLCKSPDVEQARGIVERIRREVEAYNFGKEGARFNMTCSLGFCLVNAPDPEAFAGNWPELLKVADLALYAAKHSGRNAWVGFVCDQPTNLSNGVISIDQLEADLGSGALVLHSSLPEGQSPEWGLNALHHG